MRLASCSQLRNNLINKINELCNCCWYAALKVHVVSVPESLPQRGRGSPVVLHTEWLWANWRWYRGSQGAARVTTRTPPPPWLRACKRTLPVEYRNNCTLCRVKEYPVVFPSSTCEWRCYRSYINSRWHKTKSSLSDIRNGTHHVLNPSRPPRFLYYKWRKLGMEAWERG